MQLHQADERANIIEFRMSCSKPCSDRNANCESLAQHNAMKCFRFSPRIKNVEKNTTCRGFEKC